MEQITLFTVYDVVQGIKCRQSTERSSNKKSDKKIQVLLSLFIFKEDGTFIVYSPSLDISGYGKTEAAAKKSFDITIKETLMYGYENETLSTLLR